MKASIIRPGFIVALRTAVRGGVHYERKELGENKRGDTLIADWQTRKTVDDTADYEAAIKARGAARSAITKVCTQTSFGLLCPAAFEKELDAAIQEAKDLANLHNLKASTTEVSVYVLKGKVAQDDAEANSAIAAEIRQLMEDMQAGIQSLDPKAVREAANKARDLGRMLSTGQQDQVNEAIEQARAAARTIVKRIEKGGEVAATVLADIATGVIESTRFAFIDLDTPEPKQTEALPQIEGQRFDLDMEIKAEGAAA